MSTTTYYHDWREFTEGEAEKEARRERREHDVRVTGWYPLKRSPTSGSYPSPPAIVIEPDLDATGAPAHPIATLSAFRLRNGIDFEGKGTLDQLRELRDAITAKVDEIEHEMET